jgi:uncharacterized membrane protein YkoI
MKKSILFGLLFTIIMATSCDDHAKISEDKVPALVVAAFKTKYPAATNTTWITEKKDGKLIYEAKFKDNGEEIEAEFFDDGGFLKEH